MPLSLKLRLVQLALVCSGLLVTCCSQFRTEATVPELAIMPGKRVGLYVKFRPAQDSMGFARFTHGSLWSFSWDPSGNVTRQRLCPIFTPGQRQLPVFVMASSSAPYCFSTFTGRRDVLNSLWQFDPLTMECRELVRGGAETGVFCLDCYNILGNCFAAGWLDMGDQPSNLFETVIVSAETGATEPAPDYVRNVRDGVFLLQKGRLVWASCEDDNSDAPGMLYVDNEAAADGVINLMGITPDATTVFFSRRSLVDGATTATLWACDAESFETSKLSDWVGDRETFKVGVRSDVLGFLDVEKGQRRQDLPGCVRIVRGAKVFSAKGEPRKEIKLERAIVANAWDWDVDLMEMVHYDAESREIVIHRLDGQLIARFAP